MIKKIKKEIVLYTLIVVFIFAFGAFAISIHTKKSNERIKKLSILNETLEEITRWVSKEI